MLYQNPNFYAQAYDNRTIVEKAKIEPFFPKDVRQTESKITRVATNRAIDTSQLAPNSTSIFLTSFEESTKILTAQVAEYTDSLSIDSKGYSKLITYGLDVVYSGNTTQIMLQLVRDSTVLKQVLFTEADPHYIVLNYVDEHVAIDNLTYRLYVEMGGPSGSTGQIQNRLINIFEVKK